MGDKKPSPFSPLNSSIKFEPPIGTDVTKSGSNETVLTRHQCITAMREYKHMSFEELRYQHISLDSSPSIMNPSTAPNPTQQGNLPVLNPSSLFSARRLTNESLFPHTTSAFTAFNPRSTSDMSNPVISSFGTGDQFIFGNKQSNFNTPSKSSCNIFTAPNHSTVASTLTPELKFSKPVNNKMAFSRSGNPVISSLNQKSTAFTTRSQTPPPSDMSNPVNSSFGIGDPFVFGNKHSNLNTPLKSSSNIFYTPNHSTDIFTFASTPNSELKFPKPANNTMAFSRSGNPVISSLNQKSTAFTFQSQPTPLSDMSNSVNSSFCNGDYLTFGNKQSNSKTSSNFSSSMFAAPSHSTGKFTFANTPTPELKFPKTASNTMIYPTSGTPVLSSLNQKSTAFTFQSTSTPPSRFPNPTSFCAFSRPTAMEFTSTNTTTSTFDNRVLPTFSYASTVTTESTFPNPSVTAPVLSSWNCESASQNLPHKPVNFSFPVTSSGTFSRSIGITSADKGTMNGGINPTAASFTFGRSPISSAALSSDAYASFTYPRQTATVLFPPVSTARENNGFGNAFTFRFVIPNSITSSRPSATTLNFGEPLISEFEFALPSTSTISFPKTDKTKTRISKHCTSQTSETDSNQTAFCNTPSPSQCEQNASSSSTSLPLCIVCTESQRDVIFEPCGHLIVCNNCASKIFLVCPMCKSRIRKKIKTYIS